MHIFALSLEEVFAFLFIAMGPTRIMLSYMPIARHLPYVQQRQLAWRTVWDGFIIAVVILLLGRGIVQNFRLSLATLLLAAGVAYVVLSIPMLLVGPSDIPPTPQIHDPWRLALSPLAVPAMISPLGIATLFSVSAFALNLLALFAFLGIVVVVLAINFGAMLLSTRIAHYLTQPILEVFQHIFGVILLAFGLRLVLQALMMLGIISPKGVL